GVPHHRRSGFPHTTCHSAGTRASAKHRRSKGMTLVLDTQVTDSEWAQIVDRISRRRFFGGAAGVAAALALSACGTSDAESDSASDTLPYTWGEFSGDVPRDPKRVVVLDGRVDLEFAMMMDYPIV